MAPSETAQQKLDQLRGNLRKVIRGKDDVIDSIVVALAAGGSILLEDVPGVGKTTLAKTLAMSIDLQFQRVQCTPDLLPADIFGFSVFNPQSGSFNFRRGPIFTNVLLVDEINRASPRTQSALLEAMEERQATIEGTQHELPQPFMVIATQNPAGFQGTFPLPEAQLDRFLFQLTLDYPDADNEVEILYSQVGGHPLADIQPVLSQDDVIQIQQQSAAVNVERSVANYLVAIVRRTREDGRLRLGCSPRGSLMLFRAAQAYAFANHRDFVLPDDVQNVAPLVLAHRIVPVGSTNATIDARHEIAGEIIREVAVPV